MALSVLSSPWTAGRRSSTAFDIPPDHAAAIPKLISFPRRDLVEACISFPPKFHDGVRSSLSKPFEREPKADLGALAVLPLELLGQILIHLNIHSVITFRNINRRARHVTDSLHEYKAATTHGLDFLCALLRTGSATHDQVTLASLYTLLCKKSCSVCSHFGAFVSIPHWKRCCFTCLQFSPVLRVELHSHLLLNRERAYDLERARGTLLRALPGRYTTSAIINGRSVCPKLIAFTRDNGPEGYVLDLPNAETQHQHMAACALPFLDIKSGEIEVGVACAGCQLALSKDLQSNNFTERGHDVAERLYTKEGFLKHFRWCRYGQVLWKSSGGGHFEPPEMPLVAKMGQMYGGK